MRRLRDFWTGQVDLAPVALFRIVFGIQLFNWFWQLFPNLSAFFTDEGFMPRFQLVSFFPDRFTLLAGFAVWWEVAIFWVLSLAIALAVTVGWHTRVACVLAFVAVGSFSWRNPLILDGSDIVFRIIPLWLALTRCGDLYSVDAGLRRDRGEVITGHGPALPVRLLELQVGWIYLMTGLEKMAGTLWKNGTAAFYALQLEHTFGRGYAYFIATQPVLAALMSWGTIVIELVFLPLTMIPSRVTRLLAVAGGIMLHGGILTLMNVGNFPVIMLSTLILFLPPEWVRTFVENVEARVRARVGPRLAAAAAGTARPITTAHRGTFQREQAREWPLPGFVRPLAISTLLLTTAASFATALPAWAADLRPRGELARALTFFSLDQRWDMFSPDPAQADGWMLAPAMLKDGARYDLFTGGPVSDAPRWSDPLYTRWAKVFERIANVGYGDYRMEFGRSMCRIRNFHLLPGQSPLDTFELRYVERTINPPGQAPTLKEHHLWSHKC